MQIEQPHVQRRDAVRIFEIGISTRGDQVPRTLDTAFARCVQQGREATLVHIFRTRLGDDLAFPLADDAARIDIRASRGEEFDHFGLALRRGPHQCRLLAPRFFGVDVGTRVQQALRRFSLAAAGDRH